MATSDPTYPLELVCAQEHIPMCKKHSLIIDITCEDCDKFICSQCAKTDHKDHDWTTIFTAGILKRRELKKTLSKIKEKDLKEINEEIQKESTRMEDNTKYCEAAVFKLQQHFDAVVSKLYEIKKIFETKLREQLMKKNTGVIEKKLDLEKKREKIKDLMKFLEEKHSTMSDYSLIDNLRDLTRLISYKDCDFKIFSGLVRYRKEDITEGLVYSMMGHAFGFYDITFTETNSFQHSKNYTSFLEAIDDDACFVGNSVSDYFDKVCIKNGVEKKINISVSDVCVIDNGDVYATQYKNKSIVRLSPSDSVSANFSTVPLKPEGICQSTEGELLVTLTDGDSEKCKMDSHNRSLVRHMTLTGDVIREYEYQEDGQTRLFIIPYRVRQNGNTDICVVNRTDLASGELVILSSSGSLKSVYKGLNQTCGFKPTDVVCDSHCNIIVCDYSNSHLHLLSPDGEFIKYLLTENEVTNPWSISLYKSKLWVSNLYGRVKVFNYCKNTWNYGI